MGTHVALDHTTFIGGYDFTGDTNQTELPMEFDALDDTRFRHRGRGRIAGLESVRTTVNGYWQGGAGMVDPAAFSGLTTLQPVSQSPDGAEGSVAYFWQARQLSYQLFGAVGAINPFSVSADGARGNGSLSAGSIRGRVLKAKGNVSATGATGTAYELGEAASGQYLYAALHVFSAGTTITALVESDSDNTFASATTRATFGPLATTGGTWATRVAGPITDTWYRLRVTAITGTFSIAGVAGIK
ncbi:MAG: hypothetical protein ACREXJ_00160 [Gammaproteobacteria bacterium]